MVNIDAHCHSNPKVGVHVAAICAAKLYVSLVKLLQFVCILYLVATYIVSDCSLL